MCESDGKTFRQIRKAENESNTNDDQRYGYDKRTASQKLIAVSLPLALSGILQLLFNAADLIVIGQFSETSTQSLAAVSSNVALINLIINVVIGLSIGTNVVMSQAIGSKDEERAQKPCIRPCFLRS